MPAASAFPLYTPTLPVLKTALVLAAQGADSVAAGLRSRLESCSRAHYVPNLAPLEPDRFVELARPFEFLALTRRATAAIDRSMLRALPRLKGLSIYSTGLEWIDLEYLRTRNIRLLTLPHYCTNAVAESTLGLILLACHKLHLRYLKSTGALPAGVSLRGSELQHKTVGILGFGHIGSSLARKIQSLCDRVLIFDTDPAQYSRAGAGLQIASRETILSESDFIVCCASQTFRPQTLLASDDYLGLNPRAVLINSGRTNLLDHRRLIRMVKSKKLQGYFYDDLMQENDAPEEVEYGKIVPTGHTAWYTDEAMRAGTDTWIENLIKLCAGK